MLCLCLGKVHIQLFMLRLHFRQPGLCLGRAIRHEPGTVLAGQDQLGYLLVCQHLLLQKKFHRFLQEPTGDLPSLELYHHLDTPDAIIAYGGCFCSAPGRPCAVDVACIAFGASQVQE